MEAIKEPEWRTVGVLGAARGARATAEDPIGTEHLLAGLTTVKGPAREALADEGATKVALLAVLRDREGRVGAWSGDDDTGASVAAPDVLGDDGDRRLRFTGSAAKALAAAMEHARRDGAAKFGAVHLLRGLLEDDNRAVETLAACGVAPQALRARLDGDAGSPREDGLTSLLHATRDALLGRRPYRHMRPWKRWLVRGGGVNWASMPVPHLTGAGDSAFALRFAGGERLAGLGLTYALTHAVLTGGRIRLTADARPAERYFDQVAGPGAAADDAGTGSLVALLLGEETRARQLVDALTTSPDH
ncbi:Clp protease N-terminal domain-containing protein [Streptomyces sp. NPDC085946]|uniref:Clp protease N-terminal domain-containing protein n=1 Tax=Streptomyces sp. NPDC085946 TaxID=3365744 RepID=UPI0037D16CA0